MLGSGSLFIIILHSYTCNNTIFFCNNIQSIISKAHKTNNGITTQKSKLPMVVGGWRSKNLTKQLYANKALRIARTNYAIWLWPYKSALYSQAAVPCGNCALPTTRKVAVCLFPTWIVCSRSRFILMGLIFTKNALKNLPMYVYTT